MLYGSSETWTDDDTNAKACMDAGDFKDLYEPYWWEYYRTEIDVTLVWYLSDGTETTDFYDENGDIQVTRALYTITTQKNGGARYLYIHYLGYGSNCCDGRYLSSL